MKTTFAVVAVLATLFLTGCQPSVADTKTEVCASLRALETAVDGVKAIGPTTTVEQAQTAGKQLDTAWAAFKTSAATMKEVQLAAMEEAYNAMANAIKGISDEATLRQASAGITAATAMFDVAYTAINTTVCAAVQP